MVTYLRRNVTIVHGASSWISNLFQDSKIQFNFKLNLTSAISDFSKLRHLGSYMFPAIMPWPMTLAPTNEAIRRKNCAKKTLVRKKITVTTQGVMKDIRIVLLSKKCKIL